MSVIKVAKCLGSGEAQWVNTSTLPGANLRRECLVPLTDDGTAVVTTGGGGGSIESPVTVRASAVLTASYVQSTAVDMTGYNRCYFKFLVTVAEAVTITIKYQYSGDNSVWTDFSVMNAAAAATATEWLYTPYTYTVPFDLTNLAATYGETMEKRARYICAAVKYTGATTGKISITAQRFNV